MRAPQRLADIDIAEAGNVLLVEQGRLQRRLPAAEFRGDIIGVERVAGGLRTEIAEEGMGGNLLALRDIHEAEAARIVIDDAALALRRLEMKDDVIVAGVLAARQV